MIKVIIPNNNIPEREYTIKTFFNDFLGVSIELSVGDVTCWLISSNEKCIKVEDYFFSKFLQPLSYLKIENIPYLYVEDSFCNHKLVRVWGTGEYCYSGNEIYLGNDIFASAFFFLTQWEEVVIKKNQHKEIDEKVDESKLFLVRNLLYTRCVINEYVDFISGLLGIKNTHQFTPILTHDVDRCYLSDERVLCTNILGMLRQGQIEKAVKVLDDYLSYPIGSNPFESFSELMNQAESGGCKAHFYFKACEPGDMGYTYSLNDTIVQKMIDNIIRRGHYIGLHASENTIHSREKLTTEYAELKKISGGEIEEGRTHLLIYDGDIYTNLESVGLKCDSGVGFQYYNGFRSSVCYPYYIFDVEKRCSIDIKEVPFNVMDTVSIRQHLSPNEFLEQIKMIISTIKSYGGCFVSNWHSNLYLVHGREEYQTVYSQMMNLIK